MGCASSTENVKATPVASKGGKAADAAGPKAAAAAGPSKTNKAIKFYYFGVMGRSECIRQILHYSGCDWEDVRCNGEQFG